MRLALFASVVVAFVLGCTPSGGGGVASPRTAASAATAACGAGMHTCDGVCIEEAPESCGAGCAACEAPAGAIAACVSGACTFRCGAGQRACGERCVALDDAAACGPDCAPCPGAEHGTGVCRAGACRVACEAGYVWCGGACVARDGVGWAVGEIGGGLGGATGYLVLADVNRDGALDVVARTALAIEVYATGPDGRLGPPAKYPILPGVVRFDRPESEQRVAVADFDGDGWPDLLTTESYLRTVTVLMNRRDGTFDVTDVAVEPAPISICAGDVDGDAIQDLVVGRFQDLDHGEWAFARGRGDGTFEPLASWLADAGRDVACLDLDGDLRVDLVQPDSVRLSGEGWTPHPWPGVSARDGFAVGPIAGPAPMSIVAAGPTVKSSVNQISIVPLGVDGVPGRPASWLVPGGYNQVALGDVDLDGLLDAALPPFTVPQNGVQLLRGVGDGAFAPAATIAPAHAIGGAAIGDLDGDGWPDVTVGDPLGIRVVHGSCAP